MKWADRFERVRLAAQLMGRLVWVAGISWFAFSGVHAQTQCALNVTLINHNRYAYETDEECSGPVHSVPWGNWGVNSNVGSVRDTDQFKGWRQPSSDVKVEWNSCSVNYVHPNQMKFNSADKELSLKVLLRSARGAALKRGIRERDETPEVIKT